ncbi:response regulator [Candidatus Kaiserbacteria bacterium]|nr:response regulator [Candidatus Kaiserbacteria bacterium]
MKILLVDDDAFLRDMYAKKFSDAGHTIDVAETGMMALQKFRQGEQYDVVLLDMVMPGIGGIDLMKEVFDLAGDHAPKCIVLSNQGQMEDIKAASAAGAAGYIIKAETIPSEVVHEVTTIIEKT